MSILRTTLAGALTAGVLAASPAIAEEPVAQIGVLKCELEDKTNFVVYSEATYACTFTNNEGGDATFTGTIDKVGIDLTIETASEFNWLVFAPSLEHGAESLAGTYAGTSAQIAVGGGFGFRFLVGGSAEQIALQPYSAIGTAGIGGAWGIETLSLEAAG